MDPEKNTSAPEEQFDNKTPQNETVVETTQITDAIDYQTLSIPELLAEFERLIEAEDKTEMHKNADIIKSCFYKLLRKDQPVTAPDQEAPELAQEDPDETAFKRLYARYKVLRADLLRNIEEQKEILKDKTEYLMTFLYSNFHETEKSKKETLKMILIDIIQTEKTTQKIIEDFKGK